MANIKQPKRKGKVPPPPDSQTSNNLTKKAVGDKAYLNFTTNPEFKREFKGYALDHDMPMNQLLEKCFGEYKERHQ